MQTILELLKAEAAGDPLTADEAAYLDAHRHDADDQLIDLASRQLGVRPEAFLAAALQYQSTGDERVAADAELAKEVAEALHNADVATAGIAALGGADHIHPSEQSTTIELLLRVVHDLSDVLRRCMALDKADAVDRAVASGQRRFENRKGGRRSGLTREAEAHALIDAIETIKSANAGTEDVAAARLYLKDADPAVWDNLDNRERNRRAKALCQRLTRARKKKPSREVSS